MFLPVWIAGRALGRRRPRPHGATRALRRRRRVVLGRPARHRASRHSAGRPATAEADRSARRRADLMWTPRSRPSATTPSSSPPTTAPDTCSPTGCCPAASACERNVWVSRGQGGGVARPTRPHLPHPGVLCARAPGPWVWASPGAGARALGATRGLHTYVFRRPTMRGKCAPTRYPGHARQRQALRTRVPAGDCARLRWSSSRRTRNR